MLSFEEKINYFKSILNIVEEDYIDSFKADIFIYFEEFHINNNKLRFLDNLLSFEEIDIWTEKIISRILLKFDYGNVQISDFIYDFMELG